MRFLMRSLMGVVLMALTFGLLATAGYTVWGAVQERMADEPRQRPQRERVFAVNVIPYAPSTITPEMRVFGQIESRRVLDIRASAGGSVTYLAPEFQEGGVVEAGQLLLRLDPADAQSALDRTRADVSEAEAEVRDAERGLELSRADLAGAEDQLVLRERALTRQRDLKARGVGTDAAIEAAELSAAAARQSVISRRQSEAQAEARVDQARTRLDRQVIFLSEAQRRLRDTEIKAAFSGTLSGVTLVEGGRVTQAERVAQLVDPTQLEVSFRLSTAQYARLLSEEGALVGAPVAVSLDVLGLDLATKGRVIRESASVGEGQTGRQVFATLEDAKGFRPGDFVTVAVSEPALERVALLPATAVDAQNTVLIVGEGERLEVADVTLLRRQGDDVIVRARLRDRQVVAERTPALGAGIRVRPLTPQAAQEAPAEPEMLALSPERRAKLKAFVEANNRMPAAAKQRVLSALERPEVPAQMVNRLESRMGG
ncbi:MAG: HlyD family efflux transporter periplasmic adaptor subunit [Pseudomonadota bacterium]